MRFYKPQQLQNEQSVFMYGFACTFNVEAMLRNKSIFIMYSRPITRENKLLPIIPITHEHCVVVGLDLSLVTSVFCGTLCSTLIRKRTKTKRKLSHQNHQLFSTVSFLDIGLGLSCYFDFAMKIAIVFCVILQILCTALGTIIQFYLFLYRSIYSCCFVLF